MADETTADDTVTEGTEAFNTSLGETNKGNELFTGVENAEQLGQKFVDLHKENEEAKALVRTAPENVTDYKFEAVEGVDTNEEVMDGYRAKAKELGLDTAQFAGLVAFDLARSKAVLDAEAVKHDEAVAAAKTEMGDKYEGNLLLAQKVLKTFGADSVAEDVEIGNNPEFFKFLVKVGAAISDDKLTGPTNPGEGNGEVDAAQVMFGDVVGEPAA